MKNITRRDFTTMCGGALAFGSLMAGRPPLLAASTPTSNATDDELASLTLFEASNRIQNRSVTSVQLTRALLNRIAVYDPKLNSYITVMATEALQQAALLDQEARAGKFRSPLHGIPIALKDNIDTAGTRTTAASPMFKTRVPTEDAEVVKRLKASGAVILGKVNLMSSRLAAPGMSPILALRATLGISSLSPVEVRAAQAPQLPRTCATARWGRIQGAASGYLPLGAASSELSRPLDWFQSAASFPAWRRLTTVDRWPARWKMWLSCSLSSPATTT